MRARGRPVDLGHAMLVLGAALIVVYLVVGARLVASTAAGVDFLPTYSAATSIAAGHPSDMYDRPAEVKAHDAILPGRPPQLAPYLNPPAAALLVTPLTRLPFAAAYLVWAALQTALLVAGALLLLRGRLRRRDLLGPALFCLGGVWCAMEVVLGEWDGVALIALALCWRWRALDRPVAAGLALGLLGGLSKPHLFVGVAVYLLVRREWRLVAGATTGAVAVLVVPPLLLSPHLLVDFANAMGSSGVDGLSQRFVSLSGLVYSWFGISQASRVTGLLLSVAAVCAVAHLAARRTSNPLRNEAAVVSLSLLISPHLLGFDPVLLLPFAIAILAERRRRGVTVGLLLLLDAASWLDLGNISLFPPGRLTPLMLCALAGWWTWESRGRAVVAVPAAEPVPAHVLVAAAAA